MSNPRTNFTVGLFLTALGIGMLGADRIWASADSDTGYGQKMTIFTIIALAILAIAIIWFFISTRRKKTEK